MSNTFKTHQIKGRFRLSWNREKTIAYLTDRLDGQKIVAGHDAESTAKTIRFVKRYVERHGDIDFSNFPKRLTERLRYRTGLHLENRPWVMVVDGEACTGQLTMALGEGYAT